MSKKNRSLEARLDYEAEKACSEQKRAIASLRTAENKSKPAWQLLADFNALEETCQREGLATRPPGPAKSSKPKHRPKPRRNKQKPIQAQIQTAPPKPAQAQCQVALPRPIHDGRKDQRDLSYSDYLHTQHWSIARTRAVKAAGHKCQQCGAAGKLNVHHLSYARLWFEYPADLRVLCETCHAITHGMFIYAG